MVEYINEVSWGKIYSFLKTLDGIYVKNEKRAKIFMEAIMWMMRTGAQWRELPTYYGKWNSVFDRFNQWSKKDIWMQLNNMCIENPDLEWVSIDSTSIKAHPCATGYYKESSKTEGLGRSKGGLTSKIHVLVDALGNGLKYIIGVGNENDIVRASELIKDMKNTAILGDKGYDSDEFRTTIKNQNCQAVIPGRSNRTVPIEYDKNLYKERHVVENFFGKLKNFRRVFSRFDKSLRNYLSFVALAGAILWLR
jgi:transposase